MKDKNYYILLPLILIFGLVYVWLAWPGNAGLGLQPRFDWPDETANYFWIGQFAKTGQLTVAEPLNQIAQNQIHPRSFNVGSDGSLLPGSFLGLIIFYGLLAKFFSLYVVFVLGPLFCAAAALAFYFLIRKFFDPTIALFSAILMLAHPAWWYYASSPLLPNAIFISLVLFGLALIVAFDRFSGKSAFFSALIFGLALAVRPSELVWLALACLAGLAFRRRQLDVCKISLFLLGLAVVFLPVLFYQSSLYGGIFNTGYTPLQAAEQPTCQLCRLAQSVVLPFGFHPLNMLKNIWRHYILIFWWLNSLAAVGFFLNFLWQKKKNQLSKYYVWFSVVIGFWLFLYYGSWQFDDQMTANLNTLGVSYVRYWLLPNLLILPFVAIMILNLNNKKLKPFLRPTRCVVMFILVLGAGYFALFEHNDSLLPVKARIADYYRSAQTVNSLTEDQAVIITTRKDKVLFPERKVIHTFDPLEQNRELLGLLPELIRSVPVYYFSLQPVSQNRLTENLTLAEVGKIDNEYLYKIQ